MIIIDAFIRFSGIGLLLMLIVITLRNYRKWRSTPYLILSCISFCAAFIGYSPVELRPTGVFFVTVRLLDIPHLVFVWLFALSLFDNHFRLRWQHIAVSIAYCAPLVWVRLTDLGVPPFHPAWLESFVSLLSICLISHLCFVTLQGRRDDLLDNRRASRVYFVVILLCVTLVAAISEPLIPSHIFPKETFKVISIWPAIVWTFYWMTTFDQNAVTFSDHYSVKTEMSERDKQLYEKLTNQILEQEAFKDPNLTIITLASELGVSQHRLRSLINQCLGYPNFSAFINGYRISAVKSAFVNPKNTHIPILTIAMNCGFKSLPPFYRAFKQSENVTPTEYRRIQHAK